MADSTFTALIGNPASSETFEVHGTKTYSLSYEVSSISLTSYTLVTTIESGNSAASVYTTYPPVTFKTDSSLVRGPTSFNLVSASASTSSTPAIIPAASGGASMSSASTTVPTSSQNPKPTPQKSGVADGTVAGIAVACVVGGALIAAFLVWLLMSRRQKKHRPSTGGFAGERERSTRSNVEKPEPVASVTPVGGVAGNWEKHLDQPESDGTITRSVKGLFDHIEVHVENFYRDAQVTITPELQAALMRVDSDHLPDSVVGLFPQTERPTMLIKHCIALSIVEHISPESELQDSFLPVDFVALPQTLASQRSTGSKPAFNQAYSRWRVLSSYLRPAPLEDTRFTGARDAHIAGVADTLCRTFEPWASRDNFGSRRDNLVSIMKAASETGILLFSQPSTFAWRWSVPGNNSGRHRLVLLPGLDKVRDEHAGELQRPFVLLRPVTGAFLG